MTIPKFSQKVLDQISNGSAADQTDVNGKQAKIEFDGKMKPDENTNFSFRENMRAGTGIIFREGNDHVDRGPTIS